MLGATLGGFLIAAICALCFLLQRKREQRELNVKGSCNDSSQTPTETPYYDAPTLKGTRVVARTADMGERQRYTGEDGTTTLTQEAPEESYTEEIVYAGSDSESLNDIPKSRSQELKEEGRDGSGAAGQGDFISEDISSPRQLQTTLRPSPQVDSVPTVMAELQQMREEIQRLRHLVILHPRGIPEGREAETRSWTTSLPVYND